MRKLEMNGIRKYIVMYVLARKSHRYGVQYVRLRAALGWELFP